MVESVKKLFFVSIVRLVVAGTLTQLLVALVVASSLLVLQLSAAPYRRGTDNFLAVVSGCAYNLLLLGALTVKLGDIRATLNEQDQLPLQLQRTFDLPALPALVFMLGTVLTAPTAAPHAHAHTIQLDTCRGPQAYKPSDRMGGLAAHPG